VLSSSRAGGVLGNQVEARVDEWRNLLSKLRGQGVEPYPHSYPVDYPVSMLGLLRRRRQLDSLVGFRVATAGRLVARREHGTVVFLELEEMGEKMQVLVRRESEAYKQLEPIWLGDVVGVKGVLVKTARGDYAVEAEEVRLLAKSLTPLDPRSRPERVSRTMRLVLDPSLRYSIYIRGLVIQYTREFMWSRGFVEIPTPVLQPVYGGAAARPFTTHVYALGKDWYLRVSPELYLKRLVIAGFPRVFEIGPQFRNEDIDPTHHPEFITMEAYQAWADYRDMMNLLEQLVHEVTVRVTGGPIISWKGRKANVLPPWRRITLYDALREYAGIDPDTVRDEDLKEMVRKLEIRMKTWSRGVALVKIFEKLVEDKLTEPTIVMDYPWESTPLCKRHRSNPELVERFEAFIHGVEIANAYTELNDPVEQYDRFREEQRLYEQAEAHPLDWEFVEDLSLGMPPMGGIGVGLDRLAMMLAGVESIRDVIAFPMPLPR
jgi:lysyl-tRNA synthetase class 2